MWLVSVAIIPQILAFYLPATGQLFSKEAASVALVISQIGLCFFVWMNRRTPAFWILGLGLLLNLTVILANGGLMPVSPETIMRLMPDLPAESWQIGERFGRSKDIVLLPSQTLFPWLSDRFVTPAWYPQSAAYSLGDVVIALGAFYLLWQAGGDQTTTSTGSIFSLNLRRKVRES
ncbi:MAG: DUF5317 domain-containing protein [Caldilineaceae bacterium]|nr:DUF5317 domain-containing protein [Caldilineaceae bacterium]